MKRMRIAGTQHRDRGQEFRAVRRASRLVNWQITAAALVLVAVIVVASILFIDVQAQPRELIEVPRPGEQKIYIDSREAIAALIAVGVLGIAFAAVISWIVARRAVRPLGNALRVQQQFVSDASHELRTPLAVLDARLQLLQRDDSNPATSRAVTELRSDVSGLVAIVNDLLVTAEVDRDTDLESIALRPLVAEALDSLRLLAEQEQVTLGFEVDDGVAVRGQATSLRRCIVALVDNAITHSPVNGKVLVTATLIKRTVRLEVRDHGSGIQGIDANRVFDRFAHSVPNDGSKPGFGIGLALVRDVANRYGGQVEVAETSAEGTTIRLSLPRAALAAG
jgi:two-component system, OmpR family, sensor kinase